MNRHELLTEFLGRWPLDKVSSMTLEDYTDTNRNDSFCYWLERRTDTLGGITGGSSFKFGIYKSATEISEAPSKKVSTDGKYVWLNKYGKTKEEVFDRVKELIVNIIIASQEQRFNEIDNIDLGDATKWKIAFLYSDFKLLNTFNRDMLLSICDELSVDYSPKEEISKLSQKILEKKSNDQDFFEFGSTFWASPLVSKDLKKTLIKNQVNINTYFRVIDFLIDQFNLKLGDSRFYFSYEKNQLIFTIGQRYIWNLNNGLFKYISQNKFEDRAEEFVSGKGVEAYLNYTDKLPDLNILFDRVKEAVQIELNRTSTSGFRKNNKADFERLVFDKIYRDKYFLNVLKKSPSESFKLQFQNWLKGKTKETSNKVGSYMQALNILSELISVDIFKVSDLHYLQDLYTELVQEQRKDDGKYYYAKSPSYGKNGYYSASINEYISFHRELLSIEKSIKNNNMFDAIESPLNQILYGPPGTGKTYNTINKAIAIANSSFNLNQNRDIIKAEYKRLTDIGRIVFTTFHQSMSYEDFVEGIKPIIEEDDEGNNQVVYDIKDGIFKLIVESANKDIQNFFEDNFESSWYKLIGLVKDKMSNNELLKIGSWEYGLSSIESLKYSSNNSASQYSFTITKQNIFDTYQNKVAKPTSSSLNDMNEIVSFMKENLGLRKYQEYKNVIANQENHVLIIDEINRGNVSSIFGELITLIEDSKRAGKDEALEVTLPYSKQKFSVPSNLFIIGTMNTADRSVEALDTALRRRFVFEEMLPKPEILEQNLYSFKASAILKRINQRIEKLIDRDHCIGHAYFIGKNESTIIDSFYKNIIPLLQEYFFGDYGKIGLVLGKGFVRLKKEEGNVFADFDYDYIDDLASKRIYEIIDYRRNQEVDLSFEKAIHDLMR